MVNLHVTQIIFVQDKLNGKFIRDADNFCARFIICAQKRAAILQMVSHLYAEKLEKRECT